MKLNNLAVRFEPVEEQWINGVAKLNGLSFASMVREWTMQRLEDELDARGLIDVMVGGDGSLRPLPETDVG